MNFQFFKNQRGNQNLICEDLIFNNDNRNKGETLWRCVNRKCNAFGEIKDGYLQ